MGYKKLETEKADPHRWGSERSRTLAHRRIWILLDDVSPEPPEDGHAAAERLNAGERHRWLFLRYSGHTSGRC